MTSWSMFSPGPSFPGESIFIMPELFDIMYTPAIQAQHCDKVKISTYLDIMYLW